MKCTDKERQTCNVEKMGCEGCYYNEEKECTNNIDNNCISKDYIRNKLAEAEEKLTNYKMFAISDENKIQELTNKIELIKEIEIYKELLNINKEEK